MNEDQLHHSDMPEVPGEVKIKEEFPTHQESENLEDPRDVDNLSNTDIKIERETSMQNTEQEEKETLTIKKEINHIEKTSVQVKEEINSIEESKNDIETRRYPIVVIERNLELERALEEKRKHEPQDDNLKMFINQRLRLDSEQDHESKGYEKRCNKCFKDYTDAGFKDHICVTTVVKSFSGSKKNIVSDKSGGNLKFANDGFKTNILKYNGREVQLNRYNTIESNILSCSTCGAQFNNKKLLSRHCKTHLSFSRKPITCLQCGKSFPNKVRFNMHLISHSEKKPYSCEHCGKSYKMKCGIRGHILISHLGKPKPFKCNKCTKCFTSKTYLKEHELKAHLNLRTFSCNEYGDSFYDRKCLKIHLRIHTGLKPYACSFCEKRFAQKPHMIRHQMVHTGVKPYQCKDCGKTFRDSSNFKVHKIVHSGLRPYKCEICGKGFTQWSHLNVHKKLHGKERPYVCNTCGDTFKSKGVLMSHIWLHSDIKPYDCKICRRSFAQPTAYKRHKCDKKVRE